MDYFVLRAKNKLKPDQQSYSIPGLKSVVMDDIGMLAPTHTSIDARHLEWIVPNTPYNRSWISTHYSDYTVLDEGEEKKTPNVELLSEIDVQKPAKKKNVTKGVQKKLNSNNKDAQLKNEILEELKELGVSAPKNSSLEDLKITLKTAKEFEKSLE